jgi:hypothetical protein
MRRSLIVLTLAGAVMMALAPAASAGKHKVNFDGYGGYTVLADGSVALAGTATGEPFDGSYAGTLAAADGTLPAAGTCEAGTATLTLQGDRQRAIELLATGDVCGQHVQPPFIVTQVFTGRYEVVSAWQKRFVGDEGFFSVRLGNDRKASVFGIDT